MHLTPKIKNKKKITLYNTLTIVFVTKKRDFGCLVYNASIMAPLKNKANRSSIEYIFITNIKLFKNIIPN
jgi:hypothetical protein